MTVTTVLLLVLLGAVVGTFGTLVGAGGGFILSPILLLLYPGESAATITAISLAVVLCNALSGTAAYARRRRIDYRSGLLFAAATIPGSIVGVLLVTLAPRRVFAAATVCLLAGLAIWLGRGAGRTPTMRPARGRAHRHLTDRGGSSHDYFVHTGRGVAFSMVVGLVSSFLGIGGGVIHVPLLVRGLGFPVHIATATSHFVLVTMAAVATVTHVLGGDFSTPGAVARTLALSAGVIAGAQLGAWLSQRTGGVAIQWLLSVALAGLAIRLLFTL